MHPKVAWIEEFRNSYNLASDGEITGIDHEQKADPLKQYVTLRMKCKWTSETWNAFQTLIHEFAKANDCAIEKIKKVPGGMCVEVLTKTRLSPEAKKNPLKR